MAGDNPAGLLRAVCVLDQAIDRAKTDVVNYAGTRNPALVEALPGQALRWATLAPLRAGEVALADSSGSGAMAALRCFQLAVTRIENFSRPGEAIEPTHPAPDARRPDRERALHASAPVRRRLGQRRACRRDPQ